MPRPTTFQKIKKTPATSAEFIASLDPLLRKNTGRFTNIGYETSSNMPYIIPGATPEQTDLVTTNKPTNSVLPFIQQQPVQEQQETGISIEDFNNAFDTGEPEPIQETEDGGILYSNNIVRYPDGTIRDAVDPSAYPIATFHDGSILYSDETLRKPEPTPLASVSSNRVLFSDGTIRYVGDANLVMQYGLFGKEVGVSQEYGNPNSMYESGYHRGTDYAVAYQPLKLPFQGQVVEVRNQADRNPYGNSVLVQLPTGEMFRFSHLSEVNVSLGDQLSAGQVLGITGSTGRSTGPHLDVEYYNADGQVDNLNNFSGFSNPESVGMNTSQTGAIVPKDQLSAEEIQVIQQYSPQPTEPAEPTEPAGDVLGMQANPWSTPVEPTSSQIPQTTSQKLSMAVSKAIPYGITGDKGLGIKKTLMGDWQGAREQQANTSTWLADKVPAYGETGGLGTNRLSTEQGTNPVRQLAGNVLDFIATGASKAGLNLPELNLSEKLAQGKTTFTDLYKQNNLVQPAYAEEDFNPSQPVAEKTNRTLFEDKVLNALSNVQGKIFGSSVFKPTQPEEVRVVGADKNVGESGQVLGTQTRTQSASNYTPMDANYNSAKSGAIKVESSPSTSATFSKPTVSVSSSRDDEDDEKPKKSSSSSSKTPAGQAVSKASKTVVVPSVKSKTPAGKVASVASSAFKKLFSWKA